MTVCFNNENKVYQGVIEGELEITRDGRIWRIACRYPNRWTGEVILRSCPRHEIGSDTGHYFQIARKIDGKVYHAMSHRLVWLHFKGEIPKDLQINHINGNKKDNRLANLELATRSYQQTHANRLYGWKPHLRLGDRKGINNGRAKLSVSQVKEIRKSKETLVILSAKYGISISVASSIKRGIIWRSVS